MPTRYFDDPYVYGPITQEEFNNLAVNHRATYFTGQLYIGVSSPLDYLADRLVQRPEPEPVVDQTPE